MKIAFFGTAEFSAHILRELLAYDEIEVSFVVSQEDKNVGRKRILQFPAVKQLAGEKGIPVLQPPSLKNDSSIKVMSEDVDFFVVVAYGKIIPEYILSIPRYASINLHGSILPYYRGASPVQESIKNGDTKTGLTTMFMSRKMDEGDILLVSEVPIAKDERQADVFQKFAEVGPGLLRDTLICIQEGSLQGIPQDHALATYCGKITKGDGLVNFTEMDQKRVYNLFRAYSPWPGIHTLLNEKKLDIVDCEKTTISSGEEPGSVVCLGGKNYGIVCADQKVVEIKRLKLEGKKSMDILTFINGNKDFIGYRF